MSHRQSVSKRYSFTILASNNSKVIMRETKLSKSFRLVFGKRSVSTKLRQSKNMFAVFFHLGKYLLTSIASGHSFYLGLGNCNTLLERTKTTFKHWRRNPMLQSPYYHSQSDEGRPCLCTPILKLIKYSTLIYDRPFKKQ